MSSLGKFLTINNTQMPNPNTGTWSESLNPIESEYYTENGTRKVVPTRLDRKSWNAEFNCTGTPPTERRGETCGEFGIYRRNSWTLGRSFVLSVILRSCYVYRSKRSFLYRA